MVGQKIDFLSTSMGHINNVHSTTKIKALLYGMLLTNKFQHLEVPLSGEISIRQCPIDTINISTLKRMKL